jgi:hypothetical protein
MVSDFSSNSRWLSSPSCNPSQSMADDILLSQSVNKGFTIFAPTDGAFQAYASELAALSEKDKQVVAMNHVCSRVSPSTRPVRS